MKTTIFDEKIATSLKKWQKRAKNNIKERRHEDLSSRGTTPYGGSSPIHLLRKYLSSGDLERAQNLEQVKYDVDTDAPSPSHHSHHNANEKPKEEIHEDKRDDETSGIELSFDYFRNENTKNIISPFYKDSDSRKEER